MKKIEYVNIHFEDGSGVILKEKKHLQAIKIVLEIYKIE